MSARKVRDTEAYFRGKFEPQLPESEERLPQWQGETRIVGKPMPRVDAYERVSGAAQYTFDIDMPDMLHCAILRSPHANAMVKKVDTSKAERMPGVRAVLRGDSQGVDIPWYGSDEHPLSKLFDPHCRYEGEEVAAVAAETPQQAWDALKAIDVEYEKLPFVIDEKALAPDAPKVLDTGNTGEPNKRSRGDLEAGFKEADVVLEETYSVGTRIHVPMETHSSVARWEGDNLTVWDSTQGVYSVMFDLSSALGIPYNKVRVICKYMGGGFGSKLDTGKYTVIAALLARMTGRPVKYTLSREESFLCVGNGPGPKMKVKAGVKRDGTLTALRMESTGTGGAYWGGGISPYQVGELYKCPNMEYVVTEYLTNIGNARAMRAPGFPQCNWALEQMMDALAREIGMCPVEFRLKNIPEFSQIDRQNRPYTSTGLAECLKQGAAAFGWKEAKARGKEEGHIRRGVGVSAGVWGYGMGGPPYTATVKMFVDGSVLLTTGAMDIGTGTKTIGCMVVAEELNLPLERVKIENADTGSTPFAYSSGGSQTLPGLAPTARNAAAKVKKALLTWGSEDLGLPVEDLELRDNAVISKTDAEKRKAIPEMMQSRRQLDIVGVGYADPLPEDKIIRPFGAHFAEVEVDTLTGEVKVLRLVGAHDSGRVINRRTFDNQVFGGMTQGQGLAMTEQRVMDRQTGKMVNVNWHDYKIPTAMDTPPEHAVVAVEPEGEAGNNVGVKGLGEPPVIPTPGAIANAVFDAIGVRVYDAPVYPPRILQMLKQRKERG
jgi:CO/xanthine dehydrogenase Mo-binding subunit